MTEPAPNIHFLHDETEHASGGIGQSDPIIFGVMGSGGGVGVTSLACQFAYRLAQNSKMNGPRSAVALLSLDFENSALTYYLDQHPTRYASVFRKSASELDPEMCRSVMTQNAFGFDALVLPNVHNGNLQVRPETVLSFLDLICQQYEYLVLDIPRLWAPWTHAAIGASDRFAVVTELTVPSLHQAQDLGARLVQNVDQLSRLDFVLNKFERRSFRNSLKLNDAERAFTGSIIHTIANNADKVREAANRGEPVGACFPEARFAKDANDIVEEWSSQALARRERQRVASSTAR